jgi:hypothetical protein
MKEFHAYAQRRRQRWPARRCVPRRLYKKLYLTAVYILRNKRQTTIEIARENSHARTRG